MQSTEVTSTRKKLVERFTGLQLFAGRLLAKRSSDILVARLIRALDDEATPVMDERAKIAADRLGGLENAEALSPVVAQQISAQIAAEQVAFDAVEVTYMLPDLRITEADLPVAKKGEDGWKNAEGVGAIVAALGPLFKFDDDPAPEPVDPNESPESDDK